MGRALTGAPPRGRRILAYGTIYLVWGGSFLAVREIVAVAPPYLAAGFRFLTAGLTLVMWAIASRAEMPSAREIRSTALLGTIMFAINYACLFRAEQSVASGFAAIISSTVPVWVFAGEWLLLRSRKPTGAAILGMVLGIGGVTLLVLPESSGDWTLSALALLLGACCWAGGTLWSRRLPLPRSRHAGAGLQMAFGGVMLFLLSAAAGEFRQWHAMVTGWNTRLTFDMAYLIGAASIAAFLAYVWLIDHEPASRVASYAYVNPLIAVLLGAVVAGERLAPLQLAGAALVSGGVAVTLRARS